MKDTTFNKDLNYSQIYEQATLQLLNQTDGIQAELNPSDYSAGSLEELKKYDIVYSAYTKNTCTVKQIEVKKDRFFSDNIIIEYESKKHRRSGINTTTAKYYYYYINNQLLIIDVDKLKYWLFEEENAYKSLYQIVTSTGSYCYILPISTLKKEKIIIRTADISIEDNKIIIFKSNKKKIRIELN